MMWKSVNLKVSSAQNGKYFELEHIVWFLNIYYLYKTTKCIYNAKINFKWTEM